MDFVLFDPKDKYLSSISSDGTLRIWNMETSKCVSVKPYINRDYSSKLSCSWSESGDLLAVPFNSKIDLIRVVFAFFLHRSAIPGILFAPSPLPSPPPWNWCRFLPTDCMWRTFVAENTRPSLSFSRLRLICSSESSTPTPRRS